jgi:putative DNA primase/helicase
LYGHRSRELLYLFGGGSNFKSSLLRGIREAMGDYAYHTDPDLLVGSSGRKSVSDKQLMAELQGKRLVTTSEIKADQSLAEGMLKFLTEEVIRAEYKHERGFTYVPQFKLMLSANHKLQVSGRDDGIWDRISLVEFDVRITEKDEQYFEKHLRPELDGILAWCIRGAEDYARRGFQLDPPEQVKASTQRYREEQDVISRWLAQECELQPDARIGRQDLWSSFIAFTKA